MSISMLRERIRIQSRAYIADQLGGYKLTWADRGEFWAAVKPMNSDPEQLDATKDLLPQRYKLRWRMGTKVPRTARLQWRGHYLRFLTPPTEDVYRRFVTAIVQMEKGDDYE
jgi:head-tail adaptor